MWLFYPYSIKLPANWLYNLRPRIINILYFLLLNKKVSNLCPQSATENFGILTNQAQQKTGTEDQGTNPYLSAYQVNHIKI